MAPLLTFGFRRFRFVILVAVVLTAFSVPRLGEVRVDLGSGTLSDPKSEARRAYEEVRTLFGSDQVAVVFARSDDLFTRHTLERLRALNDALGRLPFVEKVDSLFTLPDIRDVDGMLEFSPLLSEVPASPEALEAKRVQAGENPLLRGNFISADGRATALNVLLDPAALDELGPREVHDRIEALVAPQRPFFDSLFQLGKPALNTWMLDALAFDQMVILPAAALILLVILVFNLRSLTAGLIPLVNALLASLWTLGLMAAFGIPLNLLNYIVPVLLLVIGATEDVHIIHEYRRSRKEGAPPEAAIAGASSRIGLALLLTALTTMLGFAATGVSELPVLRHFGATAFAGVGIRFLISVILLPAFLRLSGERIGKENETILVREDSVERAADTVVHGLVPRLPQVLLVVAGVAVVSLYAARDIRLSNDLVSFIDEDSVLRQRIDLTGEQLAGTKLVYLTVRDDPGAFLQPFALERLRGLTEWLRSLPEVDTATSFGDLMARINQQMRGGDPEWERTPGTAAAVKQLLLFTRADLFHAHVTPDYSTANIAVRCSIHDSDRLNELVGRIRAEIETGRFGRFDFTVTGDAVLVASAVSSIVRAQVFSLGGMVLVLFVIISLLFLSARCGAITVIANLFSIILVFGLMGAAGISLNVGTCMVAAITLGIAIDDTLHVLIQFNRRLRVCNDERAAIRDALRLEINPIVSTSLALAGGFAMLAFSSFAPVREFGYLSASVILLALFTDLVLIPVLFASTRLVTLWDILGFNLRTSLVERSPFFNGLTSWQAKKLVLASNIRDFPAGSRVINENETGDTMFVVVDGELEVSLSRDNKKIPLGDLRFGDVFGEIGMVTESRRSADVTALTDARVLTLNPDSMESLKRFSPYLASRIFLNLSKILATRLAERNRVTSAPFLPRPVEEDRN